MQIENAYKSDSFDNVLVTGLKLDIWCKTDTRSVLSVLLRTDNRNPDLDPEGARIWIMPF